MIFKCSICFSLKSGSRGVCRRRGGKAGQTVLSRRQETFDDIDDGYDDDNHHNHDNHDHQHDHHHHHHDNHHQTDRDGAMTMLMMITLGVMMVIMMNVKIAVMIIPIMMIRLVDTYDNDHNKKDDTFPYDISARYGTVWFESARQK